MTQYQIIRTTDGRLRCGLQKVSQHLNVLVWCCRQPIVVRQWEGERERWGTWCREHQITVHVHVQHFTEDTWRPYLVAKPKWNWELVQPNSVTDMYDHSNCSTEAPGLVNQTHTALQQLCCVHTHTQHTQGLQVSYKANGRSPLRKEWNETNIWSTLYHTWHTLAHWRATHLLQHLETGRGHLGMPCSKVDKQVWHLSHPFQVCYDSITNLT